MTFSTSKTVLLALTCAALVAGCSRDKIGPTNPDAYTVSSGRETKSRVNSGTSILDIFRGGKNQVKVNRFLWTASLDVLDFLPIQAADPFTGVISTGYGVPPGGGTAYRATILISDPALDARSLNVALQTRGGRPVSTETQRAVEDAILSRARELRINAGRY
ncbi:DUF3576 domain-containing protein [Roseovarius sp. SCSIO 43702]|uniref:DUF3576 domain-containing protein n=1 Tax=Roseovarius sp. SCSIO 43702 TaxID=2823043 RepID=UPI001C73BB93|nr:DUF3576 domain-containing protein [Roseovarius sp. SCSIO 43702]QYX56161.1 DUF3576 domain-containing protein [Roseovarius sp. SCSIO 43702]